MKRLIMVSAAIAAVLSVFFSCQKKKIFVDPDAPAPEIGEIQIKGAPLVYDESISCNVDITDQNLLSHTTVKFTVNNVVLFDRTIAAENNSRMHISEKITIPFGAMCDNTVGRISVFSMNKNLKSREASSEVEIKRPEINTLYFIPKGESFKDGIELVKDPTDPFLFKTTGLNLNNGIEGYIVSGNDENSYTWGFDETSSFASLETATPISFFDSEDNDGRLTYISFNALTFEVLPLKKEMSIEGVTFNKFKKSPEDAKFVDNTFVAAGVVLQKDKEMDLELINPDEILFDDMFFRLEDDKLIYKGESQKANLYMNKLHNFVYLEPIENTYVNCNKKYPEVMILNGYGVGVPELWSYHPDWNFDKAIHLYKSGQEGDENVYVLTACFHEDAKFKFYNEKGWEFEVKPTTITYKDSVFYAKEEPKKPGKYNIALTAPAAKSSVIRVTLKTEDGKMISISSEILRTSDKDK